MVSRAAEALTKAKVSFRSSSLNCCVASTTDHFDFRASSLVLSQLSAESKSFCKLAVGERDKAVQDISPSGPCAMWSCSSEQNDKC